MPDAMPRLYRDLAYLWPLMSPPADYAEEAAHWLRELHRRLPHGRRSVLELGCGGGHFLSHVAAEYDANGVDLSPAMLDISRNLNPAVIHQLGDMRTVRLGKTFDAVLIHDAIDYMLTEADLLAAFATAKDHLRPGGLLIVAPDHYADTFAPPTLRHETNADGDAELTWVEFSTDADPNDTVIETAYVFFLKRGGALRVEVDRHTTGLFPIATWERLLRQSGFDVDRVDYPVAEDDSEMFLWVATLR